MSVRILNRPIRRRDFLRVSALASASALCASGAGVLATGDSAQRTALFFVERYSDRFEVQSEGVAVTRLVAEVRDVARLGETFQSARQFGIARLHVAGTLAKFQIGGRAFEVESLCPADFAARPATTKQ